jgi:hypothetical protein
MLKSIIKAIIVILALIISIPVIAKGAILSSPHTIPATGTIEVAFSPQGWNHGHDC